MIDDSKRRGLDKASRKLAPAPPWGTSSGTTTESEATCILGGQAIDGGQRKESGRFVIGGHDLFDLPDKRRMGGRDIVLLRGVVGQVIEFELAIPLSDLATNALPVAQPDCLLATVAIEIPEEKFVPALTATSGEGWNETDTIGGMIRPAAPNLDQGWEEIIEGRREICGASRPNPPGPVGDQWHPDPAFVDAPLVPAENSR